MDESVLITKLDTIIKLIAIDIIKGKNKVEAIELLGSVGIDRNTIASVTGVKPAQVSVRLSELKKKKKT